MKIALKVYKINKSSFQHRKNFSFSFFIKYFKVAQIIPRKIAENKK